MFRLSLVPVALLVAVAPATQFPEAPAPRLVRPLPMFGGSPSRNMVNLADRGIPSNFNPATGHNILWKVDLGSKSYAQPVVAGGKVFVGTNNNRPRNPRDTAKVGGEVEPIDRGVLMCFDEKTGTFLWQAVHDKLPSGIVNDWPQEGITSIPTVDGDRVYYVSNQCRVVCVDANGFADGNQGFQGEKYNHPTDADVLWEFDMMKALGVFPHNASSGCPLIVGDLLFTQTSNGVDEGHLNVPAPHAPSFICLNKNTGKLVWQDSSPGRDIMHGQWAVPSYSASPVPQVIFPGGDGWLRAFDPPTGRLLWKFDCNPKDAVYELGGTGTRSDFIAAPVVYDDMVYIGVGQDPEHSTGVGHVWCIDLRKAVGNAKRAPERDVSPTVVAAEVLRQGRRFVATEPNQHSALNWTYGGDDTRRWTVRDFRFGRTLSTACVVDDILYLPELTGIVHCFHAQSGEHLWQYDTKASIWGAAYFVDGKVLVGTDSGDLFVFRHDKNPAKIDELAVRGDDRKAARLEIRAKRKEVEAKYLLAKIEFDVPIRGTPAVANGVLYVATENTLYAIGAK
ncbi:MAG TPA: PQQ-binding-like beta-propeller repeat protein [Gemmataceae bacterium]|nr:PQQ-binding-like beta-propeller repeat protein [Gemmataceae bacterium]